MDKVFDTISSYVVKFLSPYQFWTVALITACLLFFSPQSWRDYFKIGKFISDYQSYISLIIIISAVILLLKLSITSITFLRGLFAKDTIDAQNLSDEEKAILLFYRSIQLQSASLRKNHPAIISLINRNFLEIIYCGVFVIHGNDRDNFETISLTSTAKKKLSSQKFIKRIEQGIDQSKVLDFINSISTENYQVYQSESLTFKD